MGTPFEAKLEEVRSFLIEDVKKIPANVEVLGAVALLDTLNGVLSWEALMVTDNDKDQRTLEFKARSLRDALILLGLEQADQSVQQQ